MYPRKRFLTYVFLTAVAFTGWQCSDDDSAPEEPAKSTGKSIISFKFAALTPAVAASVDEAAKTIAATVPAGTNVTALVPTVDISEKAAVSPASGTAQNFTTPVTYTVTAENGSKQTYTVTVTIEAEDGEVACYPTVMPNDEWTMLITYDSDHRVATLHHRDFGAETNRDDHATFEYADGKRSRANYYEGTTLVGYTTFTYNAGTIVESNFRGEGDATLETYYIYYLTNGRVTGWAYHSTHYNEGETRRDSATYTYTNDNITRMDGYGSGDTMEWYVLFEYDDKVNLYALTGLQGDEDGYFADVATLSKNNYIHSKRFDNGGKEETFSFTYNADGLPLTRTVDDGSAQSFDYICE